MRSNALMMALTGTPLINDIEDFRAIWQFLGWIDGKKPLPALMEKLEETGLTPADFGFFAEARKVVIDMGIVRRKKLDVAADIPARRVADIPVELDDDLGRSIRAAEEALTDRLFERYQRVLGRADRTSIRHELIRLVAHAELEESKAATTGENVFTMVRKIGQAKASLAADYTAQLARSVGKVVFFAKHIDVMDAAEEHFAKRGLKSVSIRGDQTAAVPAEADRRVHERSGGRRSWSASLTAAGVGLNLQAASNVVLAELSLDLGGADPGDRPGAPHRSGRAGHRLAHHRGAHDRREDRRTHRQQGRLAARALDGSDEEIVAAGSRAARRAGRAAEGPPGPRVGSGADAVGRRALRDGPGGPPQGPCGRPGGWR